ncbi:MAG: hypothetical protein DI629_12185 [Mesorhizobium amorphae]|nr:MAG: hypothetical protein DI629_12185 [Mesorhizobium amorphae]
MTAKLEILPTPDRKANEAVILVLKDWLRQAEEGKLIAVALAATTHDSCTQTRIGGSEGALLLGAVARLQHRLLVLDDKTG